MRRPPSADPVPVVLAAAAVGPTLVVTPSVDQARLLGARLRRSGLSVAVVPRDWAAAAGGVDVVVGARAAAWAPMPVVGAVVVLDEHDEALQEERAPTWHARDVAVERARRAGAPCLLVSPVPTLSALDWAGDRVVDADPQRGAGGLAHPRGRRPPQRRAVAPVAGLEPADQGAARPRPDRGLRPQRAGPGPPAGLPLVPGAAALRALPGRGGPDPRRPAALRPLRDGAPRRVPGVRLERAGRAAAGGQRAAGGAGGRGGATGRRDHGGERRGGRGRSCRGLRRHGGRPPPCAAGRRGGLPGHRRRAARAPLPGRRAGPRPAGPRRPAARTPRRRRAAARPDPAAPPRGARRRPPRRSRPPLRPGAGPAARARPAPGPRPGRALGRRRGGAGRRAPDGSGRRRWPARPTAATSSAPPTPTRSARRWPPRPDPPAAPASRSTRRACEVVAAPDDLASVLVRNVHTRGAVR